MFLLSSVDSITIAADQCYINDALGLTTCKNTNIVANSTHGVYLSTCYTDSTCTNVDSQGTIALAFSVGCNQVGVKVQVSEAPDTPQYAAYIYT